VIELLTPVRTRVSVATVPTSLATGQESSSASWRPYLVRSPSSELAPVSGQVALPARGLAMTPAGKCSLSVLTVGEVAERPERVVAAVVGWRRHSPGGW